MTMKLAELIHCLPSERLRRTPDCIVNDITRDIRSAGPGIVYFVVPESPISSPYLAISAVERGVAAVVCGRDTPLPKQGPCIQVGDPKAAYARAAAALHGNPQLRLKTIGVTGPFAAPVARLLHALLNATGRNTGFLGARQFIAGDWEVPLISGTTDARDMYERLARLTRLNADVCVMELTDSMMASGVTAPIQFFEVLRTDGPGITASHNRALTMSSIRWGASETVMQLSCGLSRHQANTRVVGRTPVQCLLTALRALVQWGIDPVALLKAAGRIAPIPGQLEVVPVDRPWTAMVDEASNPDSLRRALSEARDLAAGRLIAVVGGSQRHSPEERRALGHVAGKLAHQVIVTTHNPGTQSFRDLTADVEAGARLARHASIRVVGARIKAITAAVGMAGPGDVVLVTQNAQEKRQEIDGCIVPFDDRDYLRASTEDFQLE